MLPGIPRNIYASYQEIRLSNFITTHKGVQKKQFIKIYRTLQNDPY